MSEPKSIAAYELDPDARLGIGLQIRFPGALYEVANMPMRVTAFNGFFEAWRNIDYADLIELRDWCNEVLAAQDKEAQ